MIDRLPAEVNSRGRAPSPRLDQLAVRSGRQSVSAFLRIAETLCLFVLTQFRAENRCALFFSPSPQTRLPSLPKKCSFSRRAKTGSWSPATTSVRPGTRTTTRLPTAWQ